MDIDKMFECASALFILVLVLVLVATGACWVGYQCGRTEAENELLKAQIQTMAEQTKQEENQ